MGTQKNRLNEMFLLSTQKHIFKLIGKEIKTILGSQTILIWTYDQFKHSFIVLKRTISLRHFSKQSLSGPMISLTFVLGAEKNHFIETVLLSTYKILFC